MSKRWWIPLIAIILIGALWFGGKVYAESKVNELIASANQGSDQLKVKDWGLSFWLFGASLSAEGVSFQQRTGNEQLSGEIDKVAINNVKVWPLITGKTPKIGKLLLEGGRLSVSSHQDTSEQQRADTSSQAGIMVNEISLKEVSVARLSAEKDTNLLATGINIAAHGFRYPLDSTPFTKASFKVDSLHIPQDRRGRDFILRDIQWQDTDQTLTLNRLEISPRQTPRTFLMGLNYKETWVALRLDDLSIRGIAAVENIRNKSIQSPSISVGDLRIQAYENPDLSQPPGAKTKPFPVEQIRKLPLDVTVDTLNIKRAGITYGVLNSEDGEGSLVLADGQLDILHLTSKYRDQPALLEANFTFDERSPLSIKLQFDQSGSGRQFDMEGRLGAYSLPEINPLMKAAAKAYVQSGEVESLEFSGSFRNGITEGEVDFRYRDLGLEITGSAAWLKNLFKGFAVNKQNPRPDGDFYRGSIYHEHDPQKSFFNAMLGGLLSGLRSTVVGNLFQSKELESEKVKDES